MRYLALTENDRQEMMKDIGISSVNELYDAVEDNHLLKKTYCKFTIPSRRNGN